MPARILIVDDDLQTLKLIGLMLERRGHEIVAARDGGQALLKARTEAPDLIILDMMMPDMSGQEVCRQLRRDPATRDLPILMFTAKSEVSAKVQGFEAGADDYMTKPIHPNDLAARVDAALQRRAAARPDDHLSP